MEIDREKLAAAIRRRYGYGIPESKRRAEKMDAESAAKLLEFEVPKELPVDDSVPEEETDSDSAE